MDQVTTAIQKSQPKDTQEREEAARGGKTAYENAAEKAANAVGREMSEETRKVVGQSIHWSLAVSSGAVYGLLRNQLRSFGIGSGIAYGAAVWLLLDEAALTALGITPPPQAFPWQTHARGLAGHLVFGAVIESVFDVMDLAG